VSKNKDKFIRQAEQEKLERNRQILLKHAMKVSDWIELYATGKFYNLNPQGQQHINSQQQQSQKDFNATDNPKPKGNALDLNLNLNNSNKNNRLNMS